MHIFFHGGLTFLHKSHAHLQGGLALALLEMGHKVNMCNPLDEKSYNQYNKRHKIIKGLCLDKVTYSDYNIWSLSKEKEFVGGHKFDCLVHSDGAFLLDPPLLERMDPLSFNYYFRSGRTASRMISDQLKTPVYSLYDNGLDTEYFHSDVKPYEFGFRNHFLFMLASQTIYPGFMRGLEIAINCFLEEFKQNEKVLLVIKIAEEEDWIRKVAKKNSNLLYLPDLLYFPELAMYYKGVNCMLSTVRGEMWEAPLMQAMACGTPAIASDVNGPQTYIKDKETGFLVKNEWAKPDPIETDLPQIWKEPDQDHFKQLMRYAVEHPQLLKEMGEAATKDVTRFSYKFMATKLVEFFEGSTEYIEGKEFIK